LEALRMPEASRPSSDTLARRSSTSDCKETTEARPVREGHLHNPWRTAGHTPPLNSRLVLTGWDAASRDSNPTALHGGQLGLQELNVACAFPQLTYQMALAGHQTRHLGVLSRQGSPQVRDCQGRRGSARAPSPPTTSCVALATAGPSRFRITEAHQLLLPLPSPRSEASWAVRAALRSAPPRPKMRSDSKEATRAWASRRRRAALQVQ
jgi:hypothetical protein